MTSGQNGINYNFGLSIPAAVSGYAYIDYNRDETFEPGSPDAGFAGLTVTLTGTDALGRSVNLTTTTDVNGYYIFAGLLGGTYHDHPHGAQGGSTAPRLPTSGR